jgi:catechol 2,3-dioxygenase-like lactoylglutathione lyase family enzyme
MGIIGVHALIYSADPEATRAALRDVLGFEHVDAHEGWFIFRLPPAELGVHPDDGGAGGRHELSFMCDDIEATVAELRGKGLEVSDELQQTSWGVSTTVTLPGGVEMALYQPRHPTMI